MDAKDLGSIGFKKRIPGFGSDDKSSDAWLKGKRQIDNSGPYWRVHNGLYDLKGFINRHPGGSQWLELTQGTDITEAFEAHHIQDTAELTLKKFFVKEANTPRVSPYTFKEDGFYKTLKKRLRPLVRNGSKDTIRLSAFYTDLLLLATFALAILANRFWSFWLAGLSGSALGCLTIAAHNYFHQKDNFRMYYFQLSLMSVREWRISHALSHHLFPNSIIDMEMYFLDPLAEFFPKQKSFVKRYVSWLYSPILWMLVFHITVISRFAASLRSKNWNTFSKADLFAFTLPIVMFLFSNQSVLSTLIMWQIIVLFGSFHFTIVGINAAHHHPDIFHDGDAPRQDKDFGLAQLDAVMDRNEITGSQFMVLTNFGDHALHHLFPTVDQGLLNAFYPIFKATMEEFNVDLRVTSQLELVKGQFLQMARNKMNPTAPDVFISRNK